MKSRWTTLMMAAVFAAVFSLAGCSGDDGDDGAPGAAGPAGDNGLACWDLNENGVPDLPDEDLNGDGVVDVLDCNALANADDAAILAAKPESCATCHGGVGEDHQSQYDQYVDESDLALTFNSVTSVDNGDGTFTVTLAFSIAENGAPFVDAAGLPSLDQKRFEGIQYFSATGEYLNECRLNENLAPVDPVGMPGEYTVTDTNCPYAPELSDAHVYGYLAEGVLVEHEGGTGAEIPEGSHVHLYDNVASAALAFGAAAVTDPLAYESLANVAGCEKCHGTPYLKHGYRAAQVENLPDFASCKSCHYDDRTGGHPDWQYMVDSPLNWATDAAIVPADKYDYTANIMNDTHMSHAMEFPFPMTMANCVACHEDKLDPAAGGVLANTNFTPETCQSCHPVEGVDAWPGDTYNQSHRAPPLEYLWTEAGVTFHDIETNANCQACHGAGVSAPFSAYHSGYDKEIYDADGNRYADTYTVSIDDISADLAANTMTITFSASDTEIVPEVLVSFYGYDTKDFIVPSHARDADRNRYEWEPGDDSPLFPSIAGTGTAGDPWVLTADLAAWIPGAANDGDANGQPNVSVPDLIANGVVKKAEVTLTPMLTLNAGTDDEVEVALDAVTQTFDVGGNALVDNYFKGTNAIVDTEKCNVCHDQLAVTFHGGSGRGGDIVACRNCHNPTFTGSHLEMTSRSIENYVHSIHSFQDFDTDEIFETFDPVFAARYDQHIKHVFPNFTIRNCEACHVSGTVTYNVPDQSHSMPGVASTSYELATWYEISGGLAVEDPSGRNIGMVPEYVTGPASRACGACHRSRLINDDAAGDLASLNAHTEAGGTLVENDPEDDDTLFGVIDKIMSMFQ